MAHALTSSPHIRDKATTTTGTTSPTTTNAVTWDKATGTWDNPGIATEAAQAPTTATTSSVKN